MKNLFFLLGKWQIALMAVVCTFLTFNIHSKSKINTYHHVLWADAGGYYIYLPALFEYGFNAQAIPDSLASKTGNGFKVDKEKEQIITKYTYGVALLQTPFYLIAKIIQKASGNPGNDFGTIFHYLIMLSGVFYSMVGLYFFKKGLQRNFSNFSSGFTTLILFTATPLFYYGLDKTSFAHIYLFAIFSFLFYFFPAATSNRSTKSFAIVVLLISLSILIRPTSVFMLPMIFFAYRITTEEIRSYFRWVIGNPKMIGSAALIFIGVFIPQMIYWHYLSGSFIHYSYEGEGFNHLSNPFLLEFWFSPNNGLFLYTPLMLILLIAALLLSFRIPHFGLLVLSFFVMSWIFSSWHDWTFGCSFGSRSFTEYYVFFTVPLAFVIDRWHSAKKLLYILPFCLLLGYLAFVNINTIYTYDDCFYGGTWDFNTYFQILKTS